MGFKPCTFIWKPGCLQSDLGESLLILYDFILDLSDVN